MEKTPDENSIDNQGIKTPEGVGVSPVAEVKKGEDTLFAELMGGKDSSLMEARMRMEEDINMGREIPNSERFDTLEKEGYKVAFKAALEKSGIDPETAEGKAFRGRLARWCLLEEDIKAVGSEVLGRTVVSQTQNIPQPTSAEFDREEAKFTEDEERLIIQNCLDQVFIDGRNNPYEITKALLGKEGFIATRLRNGKETPLSSELIKKIEKLGLNNWIAMKNMVTHWSSFKGMEDIKPSSLTSNLFMDEFTEEYFSHAECSLPFVDSATSGARLKEVDLGAEIGKAMKKIRQYFEGTVDSQGEPIVFGEGEEPRQLEYWDLVGGNLAEKEKIYTDLGLNRYIGEAAFAFLLSYQMLTDTSTTDYLSMMVQQDKARIKKWGKNPGGDVIVRMMVQKEMSEKEGDVIDTKKIEKRMKMILTNQMIPTGLSIRGKEEGLLIEGRDALMEGKWLKWRVANLRSKSHVSAARRNHPEDVPAANDQMSRLEMMRSALTVLMTIKETVSSESGPDKLRELPSKFYSHAMGSLRDANWLIKVNDVEMMPAEMCFLSRDGRTMDQISAKDWVSRNMLTVTEAFLYSHSIVDHFNTKPLDPFTFANTVESVFSVEPQSDNPEMVGMGIVTKKEHWTELLEYSKKLWKDAIKISESIRPRLGMIGGNDPKRFPEWWTKGVPAGGDVVKVATISGAEGTWLRVLDRLNNKIRHVR